MSREQAVMHGGQTQLDQLREKSPLPKERGGEEPLVLLPSPLTLTKREEEDLLAYAKKQRSNLESSLGAYNYGAGMMDWVPKIVQQALQTQDYVMPFFAARHLAQLLMQQRVEWRKLFEPDSLWEHSNYHLPITARIVMQQIARAVDHYFGTSPWMQAEALGEEDEAKADKITQWARHEADAAELEAVLRDGIGLAFVEGEAVIKTGYEHKMQVYQTVTEIAMVPGDKEVPFVAMDGDYVYRADTFVPAPVPIDPTLTPEEQAMQEPTKQVLKRDMKTPMPAWWDATRVFKLQKITKVNATFEGAKAHLIPTGDFLCGQTEPNVQDAAMVVHKIAMPVINMVHRLLNNEWAREGATNDERRAQISRIAHEMAGTNGATTAAARPRTELGESQTANVHSEPMLTFVEHWMHYSVKGDGIVNSILLITDEKGETPIYYDYVANLTPSGLRPFEVLRVNAVPNRWHGIGQVMEFYEQQQFVDLLLNRINFSMMSSGRIDFGKPELTEEGESDPNFKLNWGGYYTLKRDAKAEDVFKSVYLQNISVAELQRLLELQIQMMTNRSGVANANDSRMAGLDTAQLETGVKNIEQRRQELFTKFLSELTPPMRRIVSQFLDLTVAHIKGPRAFKFFNGNTRELAEIDATDLRDLDLDVSIQMTKLGERQNLERAKAAGEVVRMFIQEAMAAPAFATYSRKFALKQLKALGVHDPDDDLPTEEELAAIMQGMMLTAGGGEAASAAPPLDQNPAPQTALV